MARLQPSGGIRSTWFPQGGVVEKPTARHCGRCNQPFTSPADCRCGCHQKPITDMDGETK